MMGAKTLEAQIAEGTAKVQGDASVLQKLASTMVDFDPRFEIMPGTKIRVLSGTPTRMRQFRARASRNRSALGTRKSAESVRYSSRPQAVASRTR